MPSSGSAWFVLRRYSSGRSEMDEALWNGTGELALRRSLVTSVISEVVIGLGASLGRGPQRRLLVACGGVGLAARNRHAPRKVAARMTTSVVATAFGGPDVLTVIDESIGSPAAGQVLIDVRAVGTNPIDFKLYSGAFGRDPARLPMHLGSEVAGVVVAVGAAADGQADGPAGPVRVGDEVIAYPVSAAYATQVLAPLSSVLPKPSTLSFEQASGLLLTGVTAVHALTAAEVGAGDTVVIHGASGGVGLMATQLAVSAGARVIGTAGAGRHAYLRELGAEPVTYGDGLVDRIRSLAPDGVDAAIDTVGTDEALDASVALVADRARIATIANFARGAGLGIKVLGGAPGADPGTEIRAAARLELVRQAAAGTLRVLVAGTYPLPDAAAAHRELASGHTHGKIVLLP